MKINPENRRVFSWSSQKYRFLGLVLWGMISLLSLISFCSESLLAQTQEGNKPSALSTVQELYSWVKEISYEADVPLTEAQKQKIKTYFRLEYMAQKAIEGFGDTWTQDQKSRYFDLMEQMLEDFILNQLSTHIQEGKISSMRAQPIHAQLVKILSWLEIPKKNMRIQNDFSVRWLDNRWQIEEIFLDGASITQDYHKQFESIVQQYGVEGNDKSLLNRLMQVLDKKKNPKSEESKAKKGSKLSKLLESEE